MLSPYSVTLHLDSDGFFAFTKESCTGVEDYMNALRVVAERTGRQPREVLSNYAIVHTRSLVGDLNVMPVSGLPHHQDPHVSPVPVSDREHILFMRRGDHYIARTEYDGHLYSTFIALDYGIAPTMLVSNKPITLRNPLDTMIADTNATRLMEIVQERELSPAEQFLAAHTMPHIWKRLNGPAVGVVVEPGPHDIRVCQAFAQCFTHPEDRLADLASISPAWRALLADPATPTTNQPAARHQAEPNNTPMTQQSPPQTPQSTPSRPAPTPLAASPQPAPLNERDHDLAVLEQLDALEPHEPASPPARPRL